MAIFKKQGNGSHDRPHAAGRDRTVSLEDVAGNPLDSEYRDQLRLLKKELADAYSQIELYSFQIKSLRQDMEQLKMDAVLSGLGGYPLAAVNPQGEQAEPEIAAPDPEIDFPHQEQDAESQLCEFLDALSIVSQGLDDVADMRPAPDPPPDIPGMRQNLLTALRTVARLDAARSDLARQLQNRDIQIELLKDKIEIEQQKLVDGFVEKKIFEDLVRQANTLDCEKRALAENAQRYADAEQQVKIIREERDAAQALAEELRIQADVAQQQADIMRERYQALKEDTVEREGVLERKARALEIQVSHLGAELEKMRVSEDQRTAQVQQRMRSQYLEMQGLMQEYDEAMAGLREQADALKRDNEALKQRNLRLADLVKAAHKQAETAPSSGIDSPRRALLRRFDARADADTLMELRALFLGANAYQEAVRTFRQLLVDPKNQKFMPSICLLVGEFYKLAGRQEESSFYLANPLIRDDPFARELIAKIKEARAARQAAAQSVPDNT